MLSSTFLSGDKLRFLSSATPETSISSPVAEYNSPVSGQSIAQQEGQHLQQICTSTKEMEEKQEIEDTMTEGCTATIKGVSKLQNIVSDNTKHISSCKSDVQLPLLLVFFF